MKQPKRVAELLAELRALSESDFERHRIDVLERDLTAPPVVEQVDDTHQRFNGVTFCQNHSGHFSANFPIHRAVYLYYRGDIPDNHDIHHIDHNKANNAVENLQCLTPAEHKRVHNAEIKSREFTCEICGKKFFSSRLDGQNVRYCSRKCNALAFKQNHMEIRTCAYCGKEFSSPAVNHAQFCSQSCANNALWAEKWNHRRLGTKICPVCEQEFAPKTGKQIYCSHHCRDIARVRRDRETGQAKREQKKKTCPACGEKFIASRKDQRYCSNACAATFRHSKRQKLEEKVCPTCGKTFMPKKSTQTYCSNTCAVAKRNTKKRLERKQRACPVCGKIFTPKFPSSKQVCCSHACGVKLTAEKAKKRNEAKKKVCPICGEAFMPKKGQIYCSRTCAGKGYSQKRRKSDADKQRICPVCGKAFIPSHSLVTCCSRSCGAKITAQKIRKSPTKKVCPVCGKEFTLSCSTSKKVYCSRSCFMKARNQNNKNSDEGT